MTVVAAGLVGLVCAVWTFSATDLLSLTIVVGVIVSVTTFAGLLLVLFIIARFMGKPDDASAHQHGSALKPTFRDDRSDIYLLKYDVLGEHGRYDVDWWDNPDQPDPPRFVARRFQAKVFDQEELVEYSSDTLVEIESLERRGKIHLGAETHWVHLDRSHYSFDPDWIVGTPVGSGRDRLNSDTYDREGEPGTTPALDGETFVQWRPLRPNRVKVEDAADSVGESDYPPDWESLRRRVYQRDDYTCVNCNARGGPSGTAELHCHHVVPLSVGGTNRMSNLITVCSDCHAKIHPHMQG